MCEIIKGSNSSNDNISNNDISNDNIGSNDNNDDYDDEDDGKCQTKMYSKSDGAVARGIYTVGKLSFDEASQGPRLSNFFALTREHSLTS